jgi:hypothetical protein
MCALVVGIGQGVAQNNEETMGILSVGDLELKRVGDSKLERVYR